MAMNPYEQDPFRPPSWLDPRRGNFGPYVPRPAPPPYGGGGDQPALPPGWPDPRQGNFGPYAPPGGNPYAPLQPYLPAPSQGQQWYPDFGPVNYDNPNRPAPAGGFNDNPNWWRGANPYAPGQAWQSPTDETTRAYYNQNPQEAMSLYARAAGGSPGGNLERFIRQAFGDLWSDYTKANQTQEGLMFTDTLTPEKRQELWNQWRAQTPHQRGENYNLFGGAGRRT